MNPLAWSLIGGAVATFLEWFYRTHGFVWWLVMPLGFVINWCVYKIVTQPGVPLLAALVTWSFAVVLCRVFVSLVLLRDHMGAGAWTAFGLICVARVVQSLWK